MTAMRHTLILLRDHLRLVITWSYLEAAWASASREDKQYAKDFERAIDCRSIFADEELRLPEDPDEQRKQAAAVIQRWFNTNNPKESEKVWERWFCGGAVSKAGPKRYLIRSLYQARAFYGENAANNLANRFLKVIRADHRYREQESRDVPADHPHRNIQRWGSFAVALVAENGGWTSFAAKDWTELVDIWWRGSRWQPNGLVSNEDSFVRRVLKLGVDRYVQILTAPVAVIWPLLLVRYFREQRCLKPEKRDDVFKTIDKLASDQRDKDEFQINLLTGTDLRKEAANHQQRTPKDKPDDELFVEVLTERGRMAGLPFPFGWAEEQVEDNENYGPWDPGLIDDVRQKLEHREQIWSPPLLLCRRSDVLSDSGRSLPTRRRLPAKLITLSLPCPVFASVFWQSDPQTKHLAKLRMRGKPVKPAKYFCQKGTWAEVALQRIDKKNCDSLPGGEFIKISKERSEKPGTLFAAYFPIDIFLREKLPPLSRKELYCDLDVAGVNHETNDLDYLLPEAALVGGGNLAEQPRMFDLCRDLGKLLWRMEKFVTALSPWQRGREDTRKDRLATLKDPKKREAAVEILRTECRAQAFAVLQDRYQMRDVMKDVGTLLPDLLTAIGRLMAGVLCTDEQDQKEFVSLFTQWGWVFMLELLNFANVEFGGELLFGGSDT